MNKKEKLPFMGYEYRGTENYNRENEFLSQSITTNKLSFFKRYKLRYLFYRKIPNLILNSPEWKSREVCSYCKRGADTYLAWGGKPICLGCQNVLVRIPNRSTKYISWKVWKKVSDFMFRILEILHIVRSSVTGRYDMFGDEGQYVWYSGNLKTGEHKIHHKPRRWVEYIFVRK